MHIRPQRRNPHNLTVRQHILPSFIIKNFCKPNDQVDYFDIDTAAINQKTPRDMSFCTYRVWDQRAESGYMKNIEDAFLPIMQKAIKCQNTQFTEQENRVVSEMFLLWVFRQRYRNLYPAAIDLNNITEPTHDYSQDHHEQLEAVHVTSFDMDGKIPARNMVGLKIQQYIMSGTKEYVGKNWAIIQAHEGKFIVPDNPKYNILPITPNLCLIEGEINKKLTLSAVREVNFSLLAGVDKYYFAQNFNNCPLIMN